MNDTSMFTFIALSKIRFEYLYKCSIITVNLFETYINVFYKSIIYNTGMHILNRFANCSSS